jgi:ATP phosphoribosyltransferase
MENIMELLGEFEDILKKEEALLDDFEQKQNELKNSVREKNWENLNSLIFLMNKMSDDFVKIDSRRDEIQALLKNDEVKAYFEKLRNLRSKLLKCKLENKVLTEYVNIAHSFIQEVIEKAVPQRRNRNYTKNGQILQAQPQSVVLNQLF